MAGTLDLTVQYTTTQGNQQIRPTQVTISAPIGAVTQTNLVSGANTITVPAGSSMVWIKPPDANNQVLTLKGVTGDTGIKISQTSWSLIQFDTANLPANFVINAAANTTGLTIFVFV